MFSGAPRPVPPSRTRSLSQTARVQLADSRRCLRLVLLFAIAIYVLTALGILISTFGHRILFKRESDELEYIHDYPTQNRKTSITSIQAIGTPINNTTATNLRKEYFQKLIANFANIKCQEELQRAHVFRDGALSSKKEWPADGAFEERDQLPGHLFVPLVLDYERVTNAHRETRGVQLPLVEREEIGQLGIDLSKATLVETGSLRFVHFVSRKRDRTVSGIHCHFLLNSVLQLLPQKVSAAEDSVSLLVRNKDSHSEFAYRCQVPPTATQHVCFVLVTFVEEPLDVETLVRPSEGVDPSERYSILPVQRTLILQNKGDTRLAQSE